MPAYIIRFIYSTTVPQTSEFLGGKMFTQFQVDAENAHVRSWPTLTSLTDSLFTVVLAERAVLSAPSPDLILQKCEAKRESVELRSARNFYTVMLLYSGKKWRAF